MCACAGREEEELHSGWDCSTLPWPLIAPPSPRTPHPTLCASKAARAVAASLASFFSIFARSFNVTEGSGGSALVMRCLEDTSLYSRALESAEARWTGPLSRARMEGARPALMPEREGDRGEEAEKKAPPHTS